MHNNLGVALYMAGRNDQAIEAFRQTLSIRPKLLASLPKSGHCATKSRPLPGSGRSRSKTALRLNPKAIEIYNDLAKSYFRLKPTAAKRLPRSSTGSNWRKPRGDTENAKKFTASTRNANR